MGDAPLPPGSGKEFTQVQQQHNNYSNHQQQHAFASQYDMTQQQQPFGRGLSGPYNMGLMMHALPHPSYRPGQQQQHQYGSPPNTNGNAQPMPQAHGNNTMNSMPGPPQYYMQQQHGLPPQYYAQQMQGSQQQQQHQRGSMSPRANMALYQQPHTQGQQYYYPQGAQFPNHGPMPQNSMLAGPYPLASHMQHVDHRLAQRQVGDQRDVDNTEQSQPRVDGARFESQSNVVRGPPRKPRQSGHAIWIGNLPPQTDLMSLVYHVCKEAPGLESLFLISKSNCAFANFKDEEACISAQQKIHDSKFQTVRLVSRLRKSTVEGATGLTAPTGPAASAPQSNISQEVKGDALSVVTTTEDLIASSNVSSPKVTSPAPVETDRSAPQKEKYFILKSLTVEDLEQSIKTGIWATQAHNEKALNKAYETAESVYLIFSANKSGEYFGYARMTSQINEDPAAAVEVAPKAQAASDVALPKAIPTEANEYMPKGSIMDDSERGTIFWEADPPEDADGVESNDTTTAAVADDTVSIKSCETGGPDSKVWGKPFQIEWLSVARLPFYRTRGIRNPWNSNREVKIARDGTELEPSVGRKLTGLFTSRGVGQLQQQPHPHHHHVMGGGMPMPGGMVHGYPPMYAQ
ncbi:hypothetical protein MCOR27_007972 [Pyricularia oryzae]|uniref:YTH domain-containing protein n=1 Tax=Pyricularia grisea TaxID=148305 RepID=A0ABQ8NNW3_PYRGI|nr:hypothetical protein MCOR01_011793 [Pyricularia oryzae]KAI6299046.1 hypothetical protein MCOR33_004993 [Pyricularia grisea]KAH9429238.1 hypothetical protein MCOR02_010645 [Pyricularia oryzae]KAI6261281.1 hypothetical protein MCOR19_002450 [Pyricularia oryzae]KAI6273231.1 hypothetical protein MCOR27_007972 [Pyricularia oryzae]